MDPDTEIHPLSDFIGAIYTLPASNILMPTGEWTPPEAGDAPDEIKRILNSVYSQCRDENPGEDPAKKEKCARIAWGAVRNAGWTKKDGSWAKSEARRTDVTQLEQFEETIAAPGLKIDSKSGVARVRIIRPGWGSSGYYHESVLMRDATKVYRPGTQMFINHPTAKEERERPERDIRDLAGAIAGSVQYEKGGPMRMGPDDNGDGVYADVLTFKHNREFLREIAPYIGISHRVMGTSREGEAEGRKGPIIEALEEALSVDYVTVPGAGGGIVQMYESYRNRRQTMDEAEGCRIALKDVYPGKMLADLTDAERGHFGSLFAWVKPGAETEGDYHLPIKDPKTGETKQECVRNALARMNQVEGLAGDAEKAVRAKLERMLDEHNKEESMADIKDLDLKTLKESRPDLVATILKDHNETAAAQAREAERGKAFEENQKLREEIAKFREREVVREAAEVARKALEKANVPDLAKVRIAEAISKQAAITNEGKLDEAALQKTIEQTIKTETEYYGKILGSGSVRGNGAAATAADMDARKALEESFVRDFMAEGKSEAVAKIMAEAAMRR